MKLFQWLAHWSKETFSPLPVKKVVEVEITIACNTCGDPVKLLQPKGYPLPVEIMCKNCMEYYYPNSNNGEE